MTAQDRIAVGGFVSPGAPVVAPGGPVFVRIDRLEARPNSRIGEGETRMARLEEAVREPGERMARFEGTLSAVAAPVGLNGTPDEPGRERPR